MSSNRILPDAFATTSPRVCFVDLLLIGKNRFQFVDFVVAAADLRDRRSDLSALRRDVSTDHNGRQKERVTIINQYYILCSSIERRNKSIYLDSETESRR